MVGIVTTNNIESAGEGCVTCGTNASETCGYCGVNVCDDCLVDNGEDTFCSEDCEDSYLS